MIKTDKLKNSKIYLDYNSTTPIHPAIHKKISDLLTHTPLNPSSRHIYGREASILVDKAKNQISNFLKFDCPGEYKITFTASGTEANNLIISNFKDGDIFISAIEHPSILEYKKLFPNIKIINVNEDGILDIDHLEECLKNSNSTKRLISVMIANNETGIIQPIKDIAEISRRYNCLIHSDCVQGLGKIKINLKKLDIDFISLSAHKVGGLIGAGALIHNADISLSPIIIGGGQQNGLHSGTENVPAIVAFGEICRILSSDVDSRIEYITQLRDKMESELILADRNIDIVGKNVARLPNTSLIINQKNSDIQLIAFDMNNIAISNGSACSSRSRKKSHTLSAMGYKENSIDCAIRISLGTETTKDEIDRFIEIYKKINTK